MILDEAVSAALTLSFIRSQPSPFIMISLVALNTLQLDVKAISSQVAMVKYYKLKMPTIMVGLQRLHS
jgi:hypothetical protein